MTVLLGLMECDGKRTLSEVLSKVGEPPSLSGLSRFFSEAPWVQEALVVIWLEHFRAEMQPLVEAEREQQHQQQSKRRGRPKQPLVTGYVIGDDSTMSKPRGRKMEGLGKHHSTTYDQRIVGHSLVQGLYVLLDRKCPLALLAYVFLEEEQQRLRALWQRPVTIGEARREIQRRHRRCLLVWLHHQILSGTHPETLFDLFAA